MRTVCSAVVLALAVMVAAQPTLPACCHDLDGVAYTDCTCLTEDTTLLSQSVPAGEYRKFHWVMTDWSIINVPDADRPDMTVEVAPCSGDAHLYVQGPSLQTDPFPTAETGLWEANAVYSPNAITFSITAAQYFITVFGNETSTFSVAIQIDDAAFPTPGGNGTVVAIPAQTDELLLDNDPISMDVTFVTAETAHGNENTYDYRVYSVPVVSGEPCGEDNVTSTADCILTSHCGVQAVTAAVATEWQSFPNTATNVTIRVPNLVQDQEYTFTVAVRHPNGNIQMYTGTRGTPTYDRVGQAQSDTVIIAVAAGASALFILLVGCIFFAKVRLNRAFQQRRLQRQYKSIAPGEGAAKEAKSTTNPAMGAKPGPSN